MLVKKFSEINLIGQNRVIKRMLYTTGYKGVGVITSAVASINKRKWCQHFKKMLVSAAKLADTTALVASVLSG